MKTVTSIRVDQELWRAVKIYCVKKDRTITNLLEELLRTKLKQEEA